jgi:hypothetical protein
VENAVEDGERRIRRETFDEEIFDFFIKGLSSKEISRRRPVDFRSVR